MFRFRKYLKRNEHCAMRSTDMCIAPWKHGTLNHRCNCCPCDTYIPSPPKYKTKNSGRHWWIIHHIDCKVIFFLSGSLLLMKLSFVILFWYQPACPDKWDHSLTRKWLFSLRRHPDCWGIMCFDRCKYRSWDKDITNSILTDKEYLHELKIKI